jgi:hypothetical protein
MDKDIIQVLGGVAAGKIVYALMRTYVDPSLAPGLLYSPTTYWEDLKKAKYTLQPADATTSDEEIGKKINTEVGYEFVSGPGNLLGTKHLTANKYTYMAAVGQKVSAYTMPSVWGTGLIGVVGIADSVYDFLGLSKYKVAVASMSASMLGDAMTRALGVGGVKAAPSGFDVKMTDPPMQYLDSNAMQSLNKLAADNNALRQEITQMRASTAQYPRGMPQGVPSYAINASQPVIQPVIQVNDILPQRGSAAIKERTGLMGDQFLHKATAEVVRGQTGLITLHGGR